MSELERRHREELPSRSGLQSRRPITDAEARGVQGVDNTPETDTETQVDTVAGASPATVEHLARIATDLENI